MIFVNYLVSDNTFTWAVMLYQVICYIMFYYTRNIILIMI